MKLSDKNDVVVLLTFVLIDERKKRKFKRNLVRISDRKIPLVVYGPEYSTLTKI